MNRLSIYGILFVSCLFIAAHGFGKMGMMGSPYMMGGGMPYYGGYSGGGMMMGGGGMGGGGGGYGGVWSFLVFSKTIYNTNARSMITVCYGYTIPLYEMTL